MEGAALSHLPTLIKLLSNMKHFLLVAFIIGLGILTRAQKEYEVSTDSSGKMLKGLISRDLLENDTAFRWFHDNQVGYTPDAETVAILKAKGPALRFVVFGGTWCDDTQNLFARILRPLLMDAASIGNNQIHDSSRRPQKEIDQSSPRKGHAPHQYANFYCAQSRCRGWSCGGIWKEWAVGKGDWRDREC